MSRTWATIPCQPQEEPGPFEASCGPGNQFELIVEPNHALAAGEMKKSDESLRDADEIKCQAGVGVTRCFPRSSLYFGTSPTAMDSPVVVLDNGGSTVKAGVLGSASNGVRYSTPSISGLALLLCKCVLE